MVDYRSPVDNTKIRFQEYDNNFLPDKLMKLLTVGNSNSGKTAFLRCFKKEKFQDFSFPTIGVDFILRDCLFKDTKIRIKVWDTAGQERFKTISKQYFQGAQGILLFYDTTDISSFLKIKAWLKDINDNTKEGISIILVGNKIDLIKDRIISTKEGEKFANLNRIEFIETSAKTGENVEECFIKLINNMLLNNNYTSSDSNNSICLPEKREQRTFELCNC